ncbi:MAG: HAMP domain-containing histidine kinase [Ignavibacteriaceae bacterium]|nr:HAMP domain-containing histidine kinase [Ignavibacteriaceae bacterium]
MNSDLKKRLNEIFHDLPLPVLIIGDDDTVLINTAFNKFSGYSQGDLSLDVLSAAIQNFEEIFETPLSPGANFLELIFKQKSGVVKNCFARFEKISVSDTTLYILLADCTPGIVSGKVYLRLYGKDSGIIYENEKLKYHEQSGVIQPEYIKTYQLCSEEGEVLLKAEILDSSALTDFFARIADLNENLKSKDKFLSIIAHDLKSPFTGFLGFSEYLARYSNELSREEIEDFSSRMYKSAKLVFSLIENLLAWTRIQTGRMEFLPRDFNICEVAERMEKLHLPFAENKNIHISTDMPRAVNVYADEDMIETILRNLISNAIKFTGAGGDVTISIYKKEENVLAEVSDNGVGIKEESLSRLFRIDSQVLTQGTNQEEGTGLGLILCKEFAEMNKGRISVESTPGKGSRFTLILPEKVRS